jgi:integration host factor subunit beta
MATVTKKELTDRLAHSMGEKRVLVRDIIQRFLDDIKAELAKGNRLEFRDFGVFEVRLRKSRMAQNPRTLEPVLVPMKNAVKFKAGRLLKDAVQKSGKPSRAPKPDRASAPASASPAAPPPA